MTFEAGAFPLIEKQEDKQVAIDQLLQYGYIPIGFLPINKMREQGMVPPAIPCLGMMLSIHLTEPILA